jgi:hypothetical protein
MKTSSLILVGTPFAGAALLGHALGAHPEVLFAGETWRHWDRDARPSDLACRGCGPECETWSAGGVRAAVAHGPAALSAALAAAGRRRVVVEGPATAGWLKVRLADGAAVGEDVRVVLCACDPVLYARKRAGVTGELAAKRAAEWREEQLAAVRTALGSGRPVLTVRYEDLVADLEGTLRRVCAFAGLAAGAMLEAWETAPTHALGAQTEAWGVATPVHAQTARPAAADRKGARVDTWSEFDADPAAWLDLEAVRATIAGIRPSGLYETFGYEPALPPRREPNDDAEWQRTREWVVAELVTVREAVLENRAAEAIGTLRMLIDHFGAGFDALRLEPTYEDLAIVLVDLLNNQLRAADALPYARALVAHNPHNPEACRLLDVALAGSGEAGKTNGRALHRAGADPARTVTTPA